MYLSSTFIFWILLIHIPWSVSCWCVKLYILLYHFNFLIASLLYIFWVTFLVVAWTYQNILIYNNLVRRRQWHPTPVLLPGKSHGRRSLVGCSPWGREESDMTERLHFHFSLLCIGEGNGNPLQCSCLENPRDGVTQSQTQLKWFSSSSSD